MGFFCLWDRLGVAGSFNTMSQSRSVCDGVRDLGHHELNKDTCARVCVCVYARTSGPKKPSLEGV